MMDVVAGVIFAAMIFVGGIVWGYDLGKTSVYRMQCEAQERSYLMIDGEYKCVQVTP
jgi:hypothetical protein